MNTITKSTTSATQTSPSRSRAKSADTHTNKQDGCFATRSPEGATLIVGQSKVSPGLLPLDEPGDHDERALVSHQVVVVLDAAIGTRSAVGRRT